MSVDGGERVTLGYFGGTLLPLLAFANLGTLLVLLSPFAIVLHRLAARDTPPTVASHHRFLARTWGGALVVYLLLYALLLLPLLLAFQVLEVALQAAAARIGAPLGHDFCAISLSDLLTPRDDIVKRLHAAAEGDFVIAFYNPVSRRRRTLLAEARDILLGHRPEDTPVLLASSLGRPEENIRYRRLADLDVDDVDMLTVVLVGSSNSKLAQLGDGPRMYTPRGYARRIDGDLQDVGNRHLETETSE